MFSVREQESSEFVGRSNVYRDNDILERVSRDDCPYASCNLHLTLCCFLQSQQAALDFCSYKVTKPQRYATKRGKKKLVSFVAFCFSSWCLLVLALLVK
jgi:hypothetical protein